MTNFPEKLRLREMAEENMYFARRDRELIEALRRRRACPSCEGGASRDPPPESEDGPTGEGR